MDKVRRILAAICERDEVVQGIMAELLIIAEAIRKLPPTITEDEAHNMLVEFSSRTLDWEGGDDRELRDSLSSLANLLNGIRKLKSGGIDALPPDVAGPLQALVDRLAAQGLFLVPVGQLEEWLSNCNIAASKKIKWAWANEAAEYIRTNPARDDDIWHFVTRIGAFLTARFG